MMIDPMRTRAALRKISIAIGVLVVAIQLVPYGRDHSNPPVVAEPTWNSSQTREVFFAACANCHSNETTWPWYSHVAPASWLVQWDVDRARAELNVSRWGMDEYEGDKAAKMVHTNRMPPRKYLWAHPEARLTDAEKRQFETGLAATFGSHRGKRENDDVGEKSGYLD
jgi:mono/diheme cytochrome c family protein